MCCHLVHLIFVFWFFWKTRSLALQSSVMLGSFDAFKNKNFKMCQNYLGTFLVFLFAHGSFSPVCRSSSIHNHVVSYTQRARISNDFSHIDGRFIKNFLSCSNKSESRVIPYQSRTLHIRVGTKKKNPIGTQTQDL